MLVFVYHQDEKNLTIGNYFLDAARQLGIPNMWLSPQNAVSHLATLNKPYILIRIDDGHPDVIKYNHIVDKSAFVFVDSHTVFERGQYIAQNVKFTFCAQHDGAERLKGLKINADWLPAACDPNVHTSILNWDERPFEVGFAGSLNPSLNPNRKAFIEIVENMPCSVATPTNRGGLTMVNGCSKIVVNQLCNNDINMRMMEAISAGAFLITEKVIDNRFEDLGFGENVATWSNLTELQSTVEYWLDHDAEMHEKARVAQKISHKQHTYIHRLKKILETLQR
jgi:hypothetical protein